MLRLFLVCMLLIVVQAAFPPGTLFKLVAVDSSGPSPPPLASANGASDESPKPYAFNYDAEGPGGSTSSRSESADGSGRVKGSYSLKGPDGRNRIVEYIADAGGFRATVTTNELGTESKDPADVVLKSSAPTPEEIAAREGAPTAPKLQSSSGPANGYKKYILVPVDAAGPWQ